MLERIDLYGLDLHFRHCSRIEAAPSIVLLDINDYALESIGRWPWPRRRFAQLIDVLHEAEAKAIVLDIVFAEPSTPRIEHAGLDRHYGLLGHADVLGDPLADPVIFDDTELADAVSQARNVYLPMFFELIPPSSAFNKPTSPGNTTSWADAVELLRNQREITLEAFLRKTTPPSHWTPNRFFETCRLSARLWDEFGLDMNELARQLGEEVSSVEPFLVSAKKIVATLRAQGYLESTTENSWEGFRQTMLPGSPADHVTTDREILATAYRQARTRYIVLGLENFGDAKSRESAHEPAVLARGIEATYPLDTLVSHVTGVGFASFQRNPTDGVLRSVPLIALIDDRQVFQLGLLVALDALCIDRSSVHIESNAVVFGHGVNKRRFPMNHRSEVLINWHCPTRPKQWQESFEHIPVTRVMEIVLNQEAIEENLARIALRFAELVRLRHEETPTEYNHYATLVNQRLLLEDSNHTEPRALARADLQAVNPANKPVSLDHLSKKAAVARHDETDSTKPAERSGQLDQLNWTARLEQLDREIKTIEDEALVWLERVWRLWQQQSPETEEEHADFKHIQQLHARFADDDWPNQIRNANAKLADRNDILKEELRARLRDRIGLVGYTASAVADLVTTPVYPSMPGVMAHANVINMVLQNRPVAIAPWWCGALVLLITGGTTTLIVSSRRPVSGALASGSVMLAVLTIGALFFYQTAVHLPTLVSALIVFVTWAMVTLYRQLTEERERRQFERALTMYTSPSIAAAIAERHDETSLAPQSVTVTCFYTDLVGFTSLSERLGARGTQHLLNRYLDMTARVLIAHNALVNKFMGDGVFAFFNAPVWPLARHGQMACRSALAALAELEILNKSLAKEDITIGEGIKPLEMRIGLSTGEAFVGDYGSESKLDYTCIGDTPNLGSRLEQANKRLGTQILVDEATRSAARAVAGDEFAFRRLGAFRVPGRSAPVKLFELLGPLAKLDETDREYVSLFEDGVRAYQCCRWDHSQTCFNRCAGLRPTDKPVTFYLDALNNQPVPDSCGQAMPLSLRQT